MVIVPYFNSSDPAIKEFIKFVDEKQLLGKRFIIHDLDEIHLFISSEVPQHLQVTTIIRSCDMHVIITHLSCSLNSMG